MVQLSHQHMTTRKTIALSRGTFVSKVTSLIFNMLSRLVIAFFSKEQGSFNCMTEVTIYSDCGAQEDKVCHCFRFVPHLFAVMRCVHMSRTPWGTCSPWDFRLVGSPVTSAFWWVQEEWSMVDFLILSYYHRSDIFCFLHLIWKRS